MTDLTELTLRAALIGIGATVVMDLWGLLAQRLFGARPADYAMVGRWIGYMSRGRFVHDAIAKAEPIPRERALGWTAHYAIGIAFAFILLAVSGLAWARQPTLLPALVVGVATVAAPFFLMQPGMGAGIAASRTPDPTKARLRSLLTHTVFGLGLYLSALLTSAVL
jgi:hypothetical protein